MEKYPYVINTLKAHAKYEELRPLYAPLNLNVTPGEDEPYSATPYGQRVTINVHHYATGIIQYDVDPSGEWSDHQEEILRQKLIRDVYGPVISDLLDLKYKCMQLPCPHSELIDLVDHINEMIAKAEI